MLTCTVRFNTVDFGFRRPDHTQYEMKMAGSGLTAAAITIEERSKISDPDKIIRRQGQYLSRIIKHMATM